MAQDYIVEGHRQRVDRARAAQFSSERNIADRSRPLDPVSEPTPHLGRGQRLGKIARQCHQGQPGGGLFTGPAALDEVGEVGHRTTVEDLAYVHIHVELRSDHRDHPHSQQRMAP